MRIWNSVRISEAVAAATLFVAAQAQATIAYNYPGGAFYGNQGEYPGNLSLGNVFTVSSPITVTALGAFDSGGDGIGGSGVQVAIYQLNLDGTTITSGTLAVGSMTFSGSAQALYEDSNTRVASLPGAVQLDAGTYMVVANRYGTTANGASELDYNAYVANGLGDPNPLSANPTAGVTFGPSYVNTDGTLTWEGALPGGWAFVGTPTPGAPGYGAGNFDFTPVPEVTAFGAAAVGLLGLVYIGRYARLRRKLKPA